MPKTKRLTLRELRGIGNELKNADLSVTQEIVVREVQKEQHIYVFDDRKALCSIIGDRVVAFLELLKEGIDTFCLLYADQCSRGLTYAPAPCMEWLQYYICCI